MRNLLLLFISVLTLGQMACQEKGVKTEHGHRLVNHTNLAGPKVQPGETILVNVNTWLGDSLVGSTYKSGAPRKIVLPTREQLTDHPPSIFDAAILMTKGDSATLFETIDSSKVKYLPPTLKDERIIRYEIKLVDVITKEDMEKAANESKERFTSVQAKMNQIVADYNAGKLNSQLTTTATGLKVLIEDKGSGAPIKKGETVSTQYYGVTKQGSMFDNSFQRGEPLSFPVGTGRMIPGYDEGTQLLNHGGRAVFFLPPSLAYGEQGTPDGTIKPNTELIFYVEVL